MQVKVWLLGISPMVWRRLLVRSTCTLRELHGVIQVAMGWEGIHLYQFCLRTRRYGSSELSASSPEVTVAALRLRKGARFTYEYDLNSSATASRHRYGRLRRSPSSRYLLLAAGNGGVSGIPDHADPMPILRTFPRQ